MDIHHALTHGEMMVGKYYVDGYYEKAGERIALEFNGCMHHGHACRYDSNNTSVVKDTIQCFKKSLR